MKVTVFGGDLCDAPAEALCTSTNPRLSLVMGTGASVRGRGGFGILRECEAIVDAEALRTGVRELPPGSAHVTTAGELPAKIVIHCVASDAAHRSSADVIRACVQNALAKADEAGCSTLGMPLFGTGHASFGFDDALRAMAEVLRDRRGAAVDGDGESESESESERVRPGTAVRQIFLVIHDPTRIDEAFALIRSVMPEAEVDVRRAVETDDEPVSMWGEWYRM